MDAKPRKTIQDLAQDTRVLASILSKVEDEGEITYAELSSMIQGDVSNGARHNLDGARRVVLRDFGIAFGVIRGIGLRRMGDNEMHTMGEVAIQRISKTSRTAVKRMIQATDGKNLSNEAKIKLNAQLAMHGTLVLFSKPKSIALVESAVRNTGELSIGNTMKLFEK